ncbi:MAG: hypothetical protein MUW55_11210 [Pantoea vagans]|nr:hypothetical protein [Pantoea vagans]
MFNKFLQKKSSEAPKNELDDLRNFFDEIDAKQKEIADKKAKIKEEHERGARVTKHRFTI